MTTLGLCAAIILFPSFIATYTFAFRGRHELAGRLALLAAVAEIVLAVALVGQDPLTAAASVAYATMFVLDGIRMLRGGWAGIGRMDSAANLAATVGLAFVAAGFAVEDRPWVFALATPVVIAQVVVAFKDRRKAAQAVQV